MGNDSVSQQVANDEGSADAATNDTNAALGDEAMEENADTDMDEVEVGVEDEPAFHQDQDQEEYGTAYHLQTQNLAQSPHFGAAYATSSSGESWDAGEGSSSSSTLINGSDAEEGKDISFAEWINLDDY